MSTTMTSKCLNYNNYPPQLTLAGLVNGNTGDNENFSVFSGYNGQEMSTISMAPTESEQK